MEGYKLFIEQLEKLSLDERREVIENIVGIRVLLYSFDEGIDEVVLKFYDGYTYYQINFYLKENKDEMFIRKAKERIVIYDIFVNDIGTEIEDEFIIGDKFYKFLKILRYGDISYFDSFL